MSDKLNEQLKKLTVVPSQIFSADGGAGGSGGGGGGGGQTNYVVNNYFINSETALQHTELVPNSTYDHIVGRYVRLPGENSFWAEKIYSLSGKTWTRILLNPGSPPLESSFVFGEQFEFDYGGFHFRCTTTNSAGNIFYTKVKVSGSDGVISEQTVIDEFKDNGITCTTINDGKTTVGKYKKVAPKCSNQLIEGRYQALPNQVGNKWDEKIFNLNGNKWTRRLLRPQSEPLECTFILGEEFEFDYGGHHYKSTVNSDGSIFYTKATVYRSKQFVCEQKIIDEFKGDEMISTFIADGKTTITKYKKLK